LQQILRLHVGKQLTKGFVMAGVQCRSKPHALAAHTALNELLQTMKGAATDEENLGRIDLEKFLLGMFASPLRRDTRHGPLKNLQERLLDALAGHVAGEVSAVT